MLKIYDFLQESCAQSFLWRRSGRGFLFKIDDFLKESYAQATQLPEEENPLQMNFETRFLIKIDDFLKEPCVIP